MKASVYKAAESRRRDLGVTYMELAEETSLSHTVIHQVLTGRKSGIEMNRKRIVNDVELAMDRLQTAKNGKR